MSETIIPTGLSALDNALNGGLRPGSLTLVAGRPGMGKTSFLKQIAKVTEFGSILFVDHENAEQKVAGETWKELALKLQIPVLVTVKVPRDCETREDKRPRFSDLCPFSVAADTVLALYREHYYQCANPDHVTDAEILILKNEWGDLCTVPMNFDPATRLWSDHSL